MGSIKAEGKAMLDEYHEMCAVHWQTRSGNQSKEIFLRVDDSMLFKWLNSCTHDYTSPKIQNDMLSIIANSIVRDVATEIRSQLQYSIIIEGTQGIIGTEQALFCCHDMDHNLIPHCWFILSVAHNWRKPSKCSQRCAVLSQIVC